MYISLRYDGELKFEPIFVLDVLKTKFCLYSC